MNDFSNFIETDCRPFQERRHANPSGKEARTDVEPSTTAVDGPTIRDPIRGHSPHCSVTPEAPNNSSNTLRPNYNHTVPDPVSAENTRTLATGRPIPNSDKVVSEDDEEEGEDAAEEKYYSSDEDERNEDEKSKDGSISLSNDEDLDD